MTASDRANLIDRAKGTLKLLTVDSLKEDPGRAFQASSVNAFVVLSSHAPAEWARWKSKLKKAGISIRDLNAQMKSARAKLRLVERGATHSRTAGSMLGAGCPAPALVVPVSYSLTSEATIEFDDEVEPPRQVIVAFAPVLIVRRFSDAETGTESLQLAWQRDGKWQDLVIDRGVVMDPRKLLGLASLGFPVAGVNDAKLSSYLHKFEAENHASLPSTRTSSHLGWQGPDGKAGFLWGRTMIGPDGEDGSTIQFRPCAEGDDQIADGYHSEGTYEAWRDGIGHIQAHLRALVVFYLAFVPALLRILRAPNFVLDVCGRTTTGKTTLLRLAASVWGCPDELRPDAAIHTWDASQVWAERASATITGLPLILDESKRVQNPQFIQDFIYMVVSGQGRGRGNVESMARTRTWNTVLLSSGEAPAVSYSEAGGTRTRCLELRGFPFGAQDEATGIFTRELNQVLFSNYGHAGPKFIRHLLKQGHRWEQLRQQYTAEITRYRDLAPGCPEADRLAQAFATIATAVPIVHEALDLAWDAPVGLAALNAIWPDIVGEAQDAAGAKRALMAVVAWANANEDTFLGRSSYIPSRGYSGYWENATGWPFIAFFKPVLEKVLTELKFEPEAIFYEWKALGWLDTRKDRKKSYTKQVPCPGGSKPHMVVILRKAIDEVEAES